jgi:hypothetical protein
LVSPGPSPAHSHINITAPASPTTLHTSAYEDGTDRRFRNVGIYKPDAGELPQRKFTITNKRYTKFFISLMSAMVPISLVIYRKNTG